VIMEVCDGDLIPGRFDDSSAPDDLAVLTWATFENGKFEVTKLMAMPVHAHVSHPSTICTHDSSSAFAGIPMHACNVANLGRSSLCNLYRQPSRATQYTLPFLDTSWPRTKVPCPNISP
jgi:hypothetical protein